MPFWNKGSMPMRFLWIPMGCINSYILYKFWRETNMWLDLMETFLCASFSLKFEFMCFSYVVSTCVFHVPTCWDFWVPSKPSFCFTLRIFRCMYYHHIKFEIHITKLSHDHCFFTPQISKKAFETNRCKIPKTCLYGFFLWKLPFLPTLHHFTELLRAYLGEH